MQQGATIGRQLCVDVEVETDPSETPDLADDFDGWLASRSLGLLRFAYLVTGSQDAAEDAVQTALAKACEHWSRISRTDDQDAYVRRMIVNAQISWWRKSRKREQPVAEPRPTTYAADPAVAISQSDAVWRLCSTLPKRQRAAVVLRYYDDLTYAEIAAVLACPEATVRSYVHRALTALRQTLERQEESDD